MGSCLSALGQSRALSGRILDSATRQPVPKASIMAVGTSRGTLSDTTGRFHFVLPGKAQRIRVTAAGYAPVTLLVDSSTEPLTILLSVSYVSLQQVVIDRKKRYRNRHNPAVDLIREVIAHKPENAPTSYPYVSYHQYDKVRVLTDRPPRIITEGKLFKKYRFLFTPDTTLVPGKRLVPAYLEETYSRNYERTNPDRKKEIILGHKRVDLGQYIDMSGVSAIMNRLYQDFTVYDNTMLVFTLQFMSPVAKLGPDLYEYFIRDTIEENGVRLVRVNFIPRNPQDLLFSGNLYITLDGSYAIKKAELEAGSHSNVNWVRSFVVRQTFEKGPGGRYYRSQSDLLSYFSLTRNNLGLYGQHVIVSSDVSDSTLPDEAFRGLPIDTTLASVPLPDSIWTGMRPIPLTASEDRTYRNTDSLLKMRSYRRLMDWITFATVGYKSAGVFDIGPVGNFYSFNSLEGSRYQVGGRSNVKLSTRWFTDDYVAYATGDQRWKYHASATYSVNHKSIYAYPFHYIQASFLHDIRNPGAENLFATDNSFLGSFSRGIGGKWLYTDVGNLSYIREFGDHFSYNFGGKYWRQQPAQDLYYIYQQPDGISDSIHQLTTTQLSVTLGWSPHQQFYQGHNYRRIINTQYPTFSLQYAVGIKGLLGGQYMYNAFHLGIAKRWYLAPVGFMDIRFNAGYITGNLPFPLLIIQPANPSFFYSFNGYNLMNVEEFITDHYASLNVDHYFNGFFLNKIPLLKKLRLREVVEGKILFGGVRPENNPATNPEQMKFPLNDQGVLTTYALGSQPYLEAGVGIYNILNIIRIDFVRRFTYLQHPGISTNGLRLSTGLNF
ncbi:MAG TPA: DUF5686 family protein [Puia sp.]|nr:DUF5686 family protein [Puia sp.]